MGNMKLSYMMLCLLPLSLGAAAEQCAGGQAGEAVCIPGDSTPTTTPMMLAGVGGGGGDVGRLISSSVFDQMLKYRNDARCAGHGFYTYDAFIAAAGSFNGFGTTGDDTIRKRELAAFLAQTSHETTGGWPSAPDGPYAWGYCFVNESNNPPDYCTLGDWPCAPGKKYYGRGPFQLSYNFNYGEAGKAIGVDLLNNPDLVSTDSIVSFKTAIWFWMTPLVYNLSSHDVITGRWTASAADRSTKRVPGYGVITNIINGALECGKGQDSRVDDRIGFYKRYCQILGVSPGDNLDCSNQRPFAFGSAEPIAEPTGEPTPACWISTQVLSC